MTLDGSEEESSLMHDGDSKLAVQSTPTRWRSIFRLLLRSQRCTLLPVVVALLLLLAYREYAHYVQTDIELTSDDYPVDWHCPPPLPSAPFSASRVLILSADDRPLPPASELPDDVSLWPYFVLTNYINARYAARHGYAYRRATSGGQTSRGALWNKLWQLLHAVDWAAYDFVLAVDSDAWFTHSRLPLHDMLRCHSPDWLSPTDTTPDLLFSHDWALVASRHDDLNAGVYLLRTTPRARALVERWWALAELPQHSHFQQGWPAEQGVLNELLLRNSTTAAAVRALPRQVIYGHAAAYISHVTSWWPLQRGWRSGRREQLIMRDIVRADFEDTLK